MRFITWLVTPVDCPINRACVHMGLVALAAMAVMLAIVELNR